MAPSFAARGPAARPASTATSTITRAPTRHWATVIAGGRSEEVDGSSARLLGGLVVINADRVTIRIVARYNENPGGRSKTFADRKSTRLNSSHSQISYA